MTMYQYLIPSALVVLHLLVSARILLRPHRQPAARIAWLVIVHVIPLIGILIYLMFGEVYLGSRQSRNYKRALTELPSQTSWQANLAIPEQYLALFKLAHSINKFLPVPLLHASLAKDSDAVIAQLVADIQAAQQHIHIVFYIWLPDHNGSQIAYALQAAAQRGVQCRVLVDSVGSHSLIHSVYWKTMQAAGVKLACALPLGVFPPLTGRIDIRNHRKLVVIDQHITYCGSQNCADPAFLPKAKYAPWVDIMLRFEGELAKQNQYLFASDWIAHTQENLTSLLDAPNAQPINPSPIGEDWVQAIGTGATTRASAISEMFALLIHSAHQHLMITTPYYVPDESMHNALCTAAYRGVDVTIMFPAHNDSWIVSAASRSYYHSLLIAGVKIYEYPKGLLHAKTLTLDGQISMIGSTNLDRRSFDLNYENNVLMASRSYTAMIYQRQLKYLADSQPISLATVQAWSLPKRLWNNAVAILGPVL